MRRLLPAAAVLVVALAATPALAWERHSHGHGWRPPPPAWHQPYRHHGWSRPWRPHHAWNGYRHDYRPYRWRYAERDDGWGYRRGW